MTINYVRGASLSSAAFRAQIQQTLAAFGATGFRCGWEEGRAAVTFNARRRQIRFILDLPAATAQPGSAGDPLRPRATKPGRNDSEEAARRHWHSLSLLITAKLEAVAAGIVSFEEEFLAYTVLPGGRTLFQATTAAVTAAYTTRNQQKGMPAHDRKQQTDPDDPAGTGTTSGQREHTACVTVEAGHVQATSRQ